MAMVMDIPILYLGNLSRCESDAYIYTVLVGE